MLKAQVTIFLQPSFWSQAFASLTLRSEVNLLLHLLALFFFSTLHAYGILVPCPGIELGA